MAKIDTDEAAVRMAVIRLENATSKLTSLLRAAKFSQKRKEDSRRTAHIEEIRKRLKSKV